MNMIIENIRLALFSIKANKMRSLLTMLGIIIGIASVIAIVTVGNSLSTYMTGELSSMGTNNVNISISQKPVKEGTDETGRSFGDDSGGMIISEDDLITTEMIENLYENYKDQIQAISVTRSISTENANHGKKTAPIELNGVTLGSFAIDNVELLAGRYFIKQETEGAKKVCVASDVLVKKLFGEDISIDDAIGEKVNVSLTDGRFADMVIVGIYKYEASAFEFSFGGEKSTTLYIPLKTANELAHRNDYYTYFTVQVKAGINPDEFGNTAEQFLSTYYRKNRYWTIDSFSIASMVKMMTGMMGTLTTAISVIAGIALLVGGIGVMNIMLVSITERTREIGTRKALGAPNSSIRLQFIVEAVIICLIGGLIGIVIGVIGGMAAASFITKAPGVPSVPSIFLAMGFSMAIGVFFGYYPANKAAKMDPIEALRYE